MIDQAKSTKNVKNNKPNSNARKRASEGFRSSDGFSPQVRKSQTMIFSSDEIYLTKYTSVGIERALRNINYNTSKILDKSFNIFELKELIGQDNSNRNEIIDQTIKDGLRQIEEARKQPRVPCCRLHRRVPTTIGD